MTITNLKHCDHYGRLKSVVLKEHFVLSFSVEMFKIAGVNVWTLTRNICQNVSQ